MQGDVNPLQRLALQELIKEEVKEENRRETMRFKIQAAIAFPGSAQKILAGTEQEEEEFEEIEDYDPDNPGFSQEGIDLMLKSLAEFGFHSETIEE